MHVHKLKLLDQMKHPIGCLNLMLPSIASILSHTNHPYGLQFKKIHLFLVIVLAGDIATNPGPNNQQLRFVVFHSMGRVFEARDSYLKDHMPAI